MKKKGKEKRVERIWENRGEAKERESACGGAARWWRGKGSERDLGGGGGTVEREGTV